MSKVESTALIDGLLSVVSYDKWASRASRTLDLGLPDIKFSKNYRISPRLTIHHQMGVLAGDWLPISADREFTFEGMVHTPAQFPGKSKSILVHSQGLRARYENLVEIDSPVILVGGAKNYYHWLVDYLPRLLISEGLSALDDWKIIINKDITSFQAESLQLLDIEPSRLIHLAINDAAIAPEVAVPTLMGNTTLCHPAVRTALRRAFPPSGAQRRRRRIFLSRADVQSRRLANEIELMSLLADYGFERHVLGLMEFQEQIDLFADAEAVVAVHGAGLTNLLFSQSHIAVYEIALKRWRPTFMVYVARLGLQDHQFIDAEVAEQRNVDPLMNDWVVDLVQMSDQLKRRWG